MTGQPRRTVFSVPGRAGGVVFFKVPPVFRRTLRPALDISGNRRMALARVSTHVQRQIPREPHGPGLELTIVSEKP